MKFCFSQVALIAALALPAAAGLSGCAMGNTSILSEDQTTVGQKLAPGKTRKDDVLRMWGEPSEKTFVDGQETWVYRAADTKFRTYVPFVGMAMGNNGVDTTDLTIWWQKNGTVARHTLSKARNQ